VGSQLTYSFELRDGLGFHEPYENGDGAPQKIGPWRGRFAPLDDDTDRDPLHGLAHGPRPQKRSSDDGIVASVAP